VSTAEGGVSQAESTIAEAEHGVAVARARLQTAQARQREQEANSTKATRDVERLKGLLTKDEILKRVWPDSFVEEGNLSVNIFALRKALGDDGNQHQFIKTVPKRGYRFVASVLEVWGENAVGGRQPRRERLEVPAPRRHAVEAHDRGRSVVAVLPDAQLAHPEPCLVWPAIPPAASGPRPPIPSGPRPSTATGPRPPRGARGPLRSR